MAKTPFLGLRDTRLRTCRGGTLEANLPVSRPTSSPQCTIACGTIQPLAHVLGVECSTPTAERIRVGAVELGTVLCKCFSPASVGTVFEHL